MRHLRELFSWTLASNWILLAGNAASQQACPMRQAGTALSFPTVLYGVAYYNEYMPRTTQTRRGWRKMWR